MSVGFHKTKTGRVAFSGVDYLALAEQIKKDPRARAQLARAAGEVATAASRRADAKKRGKNET
jgi:hypothetical protein